ncbi:hypothetical protein ABBQ32_012855 [Trebouxia sp. C0010 RCD-2024]
MSADASIQPAERLACYKPVLSCVSGNTASNLGVTKEVIHMRGTAPRLKAVMNNICKQDARECFGAVSSSVGASLAKHSNFKAWSNDATDPPMCSGGHFQARLL